MCYVFYSVILKIEFTYFRYVLSSFDYTTSYYDKMTELQKKVLLKSTQIQTQNQIQNENKILIQITNQFGMCKIKTDEPTIISNITISNKRKHDDIYKCSGRWSYGWPCWWSNSTNTCDDLSVSDISNFYCSDDSDDSEHFDYVDYLQKHKKQGYESDYEDYNDHNQKNKKKQRSYSF